MQQTIDLTLYFTIVGVYSLIAISALVGAVLVASTREDAFTVAERHNKWIWAGLLLLSSVALFAHMEFLSWIGVVITGLYWFDVRPQINDILNGNYGW
ncbi:MAG: DUF2516 family protein [Corynebacterium sp.]|nr:DUF2516 family protein [Corynebacterium sp.]